MIFVPTKKIKKFSVEVKKNILNMAFVAGASSSHFGGALSIVEIISFLFSHKMKIKKDDPSWADRDRFILSKGHACLAYYAAIALSNFKSYLSLIFSSEKSYSPFKFTCFQVIIGTSLKLRALRDPLTLKALN